MSLRWTSYPASKQPRGRGVKNAKWPFFAGFRSVSLSKSATKLLCAKTVSSRVVRHLLAYLFVHRLLVRDIPLNANFVHEVNHPLARRALHPVALNRCLLTGVTATAIYSNVLWILQTIFIFWPQLTHTVARSLCDSWATCSSLYLLNEWRYFNETDRN